MKIEMAISGLIKYIDKHIYPDMNGLQQVGYMTIAETLKDSTGVINELLRKNIFLRMVLSANSDGEINIDRLRAALISVIRTKGSIEIDVPMYGKFTLTNEDVNEILNFITEENRNENALQSY